MANIRFETEIESLNGIKYKVQIYDTLYTGSASDFSLGSAPVIKFDSAGSEKFNEILASKCELEFVLETSSQVTFWESSFRSDTYSERDVYVFIYQFTDSYKLMWTGYVLQDLSTTEDVALPKSILLQAVDGLSVLKEIPFVPNALSAGTSPFTESQTYIPAGTTPTNADSSWGSGGYHRMSFWIAEVLGYAGTASSSLTNASISDYEISISANWYNTKMDATEIETNDTFFLTAINARQFYKANEASGSNDDVNYNAMSCYDALRNMLRCFGARIFYWGHKFYIIQIGLYSSLETGTDASPVNIKTQLYNKAGVKQSSGNLVGNNDITRYSLSTTSSRPTTPGGLKKLSGTTYDDFAVYKKTMTSFTSVSNLNLFNSFVLIPGQTNNPPSMVGGLSGGNQIAAIDTAFENIGTFTDAKDFTGFFLNIFVKYKNGTGSGNVYSHNNWTIQAKPSSTASWDTSATIVPVVLVNNSTNAITLEWHEAINFSTFNPNTQTLLYRNTYGKNSAVPAGHTAKNPFQSKILVDLGTTIANLVTNTSVGNDFSNLLPTASVMSGDWDFRFFAAVHAQAKSPIGNQKKHRGHGVQSQTWTGSFGRPPFAASAIPTLLGPNLDAGDISYQVLASNNNYQSIFAVVSNGQIASYASHTNVSTNTSASYVKQVPDTLWGDTLNTNAPGSLYVDNGSGFEFTDFTGQWGKGVLNGTDSLTGLLLKEVLFHNTKKTYKGNFTFALSNINRDLSSNAKFPKQLSPLTIVKDIDFNNRKFVMLNGGWNLITNEVSGSWFEYIYEAQNTTVRSIDTGIGTTVNTGGGGSIGTNNNDPIDIGASTGFAPPSPSNLVSSGFINTTSSSVSARLSGNVTESKNASLSLRSKFGREPFTITTGVIESGSAITTIPIDGTNIEADTFKQGDVLIVVDSLTEHKVEIATDVGANATSLTVTNTTLDEDIPPGAFIYPDSDDLYVQYQHKTRGSVGSFDVTSTGMQSGSVNITSYIDDDSFGTASANSLATSESIKNYVDAQVDTADTLQEVTDNGANTTNNITIGSTYNTLYKNDGFTFTDNQDYNIISGSTKILDLHFNEHKFYIGGSEKMRLDSTGLGIGTSSPSQKLHVDGHVLISGEKYYYVNGTGAGMGSDASGNLILRQNSANLMTTSGSNATFSGNVTTGASLISTNAIVDNVVAKTSSGNITFKTNGGSTIAQYANDLSATFASNVIISGDLTVNGTTVTVDTTNLNVKDKNITINYSTGDSSSTADGAGITIQDAVNSTTDATILWNATNDEFDFSHGITITGNLTFDSSSGRDILFGDNLGAALEFKEGSNLYMRFITTNGSEAITLEKATTISNSLQVNSFDVNGATQLDGTLTVGVDDTGYDVKFFGATSGSFMLWDESDDSLKFRDNVKAKFGDGNDLALHHSGSQSEIKNLTGNLIIENTADDADIIFKTDDGSGGTTTYLTLDGGFSTPQVRIPDNVTFSVGDSQDLRLEHDGSDSRITQGGTGDLIIRQTVNDADLILQCDDGSGGNTAYITLDGSVARTVFGKNARFNDNVILQIGSSADMQIYHNGTDSYILNGTGDLEIINNTDDGDIILSSDDGSGGTTAYLTLDGGLGFTTAQKEIRLEDGVRLRMGVDGDGYIYHTGSAMELYNTTGDITIKQDQNDGDIIFQSDDGSGGVTTYFYLDGGNTNVRYLKNIFLLDNVILLVGSGSDLKIYHDGTDSRMENYTGNLTIQQRADDKDILFQCDDGSGGLTDYLRLDGGDSRAAFSVNARWDDDKQVQVGSSSDGAFYHNGTVTRITNVTGDLEIINYADDKDIIFKSDDGSGGTETYFFLDGSASSGNPVTIFPDSSGLYFGTGADCMLRHDGTDMTFENNAGDLIISCATNDKDIILKSDDGSGGTTAYLTLDGSESMIMIYKSTRISDNHTLQIGSSADLRIEHNGTNSYIENHGGDLEIQQLVDDKDIIFKCDDGSGGLTEYLRFDGGSTHTFVSQRMVFDDNAEIYLGAGADFYLWHNGSNTYMYNNTGDFVIQQRADDGDITFSCDDGAGGVTEYFRLDGGDVRTIASKPFRFLDGMGAEFGTGLDMQMYHNGSEGTLENITGNLRIIQNADDGDIQFKCDDGSGGTTEYFRLDGGSVRSEFSKPVRVIDNISLEIGTGADLQFSHNGTNSSIVNYGGDLNITNTVDDGDITFNSDDGSGGNAEYFRLDGGDVATRFSKQLVMQDNVGFSVGSGVDFTIQHNGSHTFVDNFTGDLYLRQNATDEDIFFMADDGTGNALTYFLLDGSAATHNGSFTTAVYTQWSDRSHIALGGAKDMQLYHDGSNSYIQQIDGATGDLIIEQGVDDGDIIFKSDDGSGGTETYFFLDGSTGRTIFPDNKELRFGTGSDLNLYHDGTDSYIVNNTGDLKLYNNTDDGNISFYSDNGSGGTAEYLRIWGQYKIVQSLQNFKVGDNTKMIAGNGEDLQIYHDGSNSYIRQNGTGDLIIQQDVDDGDMIFKSDDGSGGTSEYFRLDGGVTRTIFSAPITVGQDDTGYDVVFYGATSGRYMAWDESQDSLELTDDVQLKLGTGADLQLVHDGSNSYIRTNASGTGNLIITQNIDDADLIFKCDDGSGGTTAYITLDGSNTRIDISKFMRFADGVEARFGAQSDLQVHHDGSNSYITQNGTGDLYIKQMTTDEDLIFQCDDGSGGDATYFFLDGSRADGTFLYTEFPDNSIIGLGNDTDAQMYHNGTNSIIDNYTGNFVIQQKADDKDIIFSCDDGSGGVTPYITLDGSQGFTTLQKAIRAEDNVNIQAGTSGDLRIYHNGSNSVVQNVTGNLTIENTVDDGDIILQSDDGSGGVTAYITLDGSAARTVFSQHTEHGDNKKAFFGNSLDLQIYHDATNSYIENGTGNLNIMARADDADMVFWGDDGSGGDGEYFRLDGSLSDASSDYRYTVWPDKSVIAIGAGSDLQLYHNSSDSYVDNYTGDLYIRNNADNKDIIFQSDDGSGGVETFFYLDGSATSGSPVTVFPDSSYLYFGTGLDLYFAHDGSNSRIQNDTGHLYITNRADDSDIIFQSDDGSGGVATYFFLDGSGINTNFQKNTIHKDSAVAYFGGASDMGIYHNGTNSYIENATGNLEIINHQNDGDIIFKCDDGSGGLATYLTLDGGFSVPYVALEDSTILALGTHKDFLFTHDGTDSKIDNMNTGDIKIRNFADDKDILFQTDNGSGGVTDYIRLDGSQTTVNVYKNLLINTTTDAGVPLYVNGVIRAVGGGIQAAQDYGFTLNDEAGNNRYGLKFGAAGTVGGSNLLMLTNRSLHSATGGGMVTIGGNNSTSGVSEVEIARFDPRVAATSGNQKKVTLDAVLELTQQTAPANPATGKSIIYMDSSDGAIKVKINYGGTVVTRTIALFSD